MKKLILLLVFALLIISCSSNYTNNTNVSFNKEILFKVGDKEVTKGSIYKMLTYDKNMPYLIISLAQAKLLDQLIPTTDEITKKAKEEVEKTKNQLGENFEQMLKDVRNQTEAEFLGSVIEGIKRETFIKDQISKNKDKLLAQFQPTKLNYLAYDKEEDAKKALESLKTGKSAIETSKEVPVSTKLNSVLTDSIVTKNAIPSILRDSNDPKLENGVVDKIYNDSALNIFYVIKWIESDYKKLADEFNDFAIGNSEITNKIMADTMKEYKFKVYEQSIYENIKKHQQLNVFSPVN